MIPWKLLLLLVTVVQCQQFIPIERDSTTIAPPLAHGNNQMTGRHHRHRHRRPTISDQEKAQLRYLERLDEQQEQYEQQRKAQQNAYYDAYFDKMKNYAIDTHIRRYNTLMAQQQQERERFLKNMRDFGVKEEDVLHEIGSSPVAAQQLSAPAPSNPFGDAQQRSEITGRHINKARAGAATVLEPRPPSNIEPRPENRDLHMKAVALETLCTRFLPTVRKHCFGNKTEKSYVKKCNGYFKDCGSMIPKGDSLYSIANAFSSRVGINVATVGVKGIPYYPINEEGAVEVGRNIDVPFGSWGGGYSDSVGVRDYWSQNMEVGANWYEGKYGYKSGWSVPLVQSLGIEGDTHAVVSVPLKPGEAGKPIGVDVGGGVGPYYQQNQHVGVDYLNGNVNTNFGVGVPFAGVGVNTGVGVQFPSVNDFVG